MTDQALMLALVLLAAMLVSYVWMGFALGAVLRKLDDRAARAWVPVGRWVAAARVAHQPAAPVAIARTVGLGGLLAVGAGAVLALADADVAAQATWGPGGVGALLADTAIADVAIDPRPVLIVGLCAAILGSLVGWGLWIHGSGTIEMRLRAPAALSWIAALAPAVWASVLGWGTYGRTGSLAARLASRAPQDAGAVEPEQADGTREDEELVSVAAAIPALVSSDPLPKREPPARPEPTVDSAESLDTSPIMIPGGLHERWRGFPADEPSPAAQDREPLLPDPAGPSTGAIDLGGRWDELRAGAAVDSDDGPRPATSDLHEPAPEADPVEPADAPAQAPAARLPQSPYLARASSPAESGATAALEDGLPGWVTGAIPVVPSALAAAGSNESDDEDPPQAPPASALEEGQDEEAVEDPDEQTIVVKRGEASWVLEIVGGARYRLPDDSVVIGRATARPAPETLAIEDATRTMSKVHAELTLEENGWHVRDLGSTNGTYLRDGDEEWPVVGDRPVLVEGALLLGDLEARILPDERRG